MQPWKGARTGALVAIALALGLAGVARADDGVSLVRFQLPNAAAVDTLNDMGADLAENLIPGPDGTVYADAVAAPQQEAESQALGYKPIITLQDEATAEQNQRDRNATLA